jgi:putative transcriptional regulator
MMDYSAKLKEIREKLLISQDDLAKELGFSFATVNRWENGRHEPSLKGKRAIRDFCKKHKI